MVDQMMAPNQNAVMSYIGLRRSIGVIGIALPFVLMALGGDHRSSISSYYYSSMRDLFVGSMIAVGVFLLSYRFGQLDDMLGNIAGVAAIGVALFPTTPDGPTTEWQETKGTVHLVCAGVFFLALAIFSLFLFTKENGHPSKKTKARKTIYVTCGVVILGCLAGAVLTGTYLSLELKEQLRPLFWFETVGIVAFGVSWFVKGKTVLTD